MSAYPLIPGLKIIKFSSRNIDEPDNPELPWKLGMLFRLAEFTTLALVGLYGGSEELIVRGNTKEDLLKFIELEELGTHVRLTRVTITGPDGKPEEIAKESLRS